MISLFMFFMAIHSQSFAQQPLDVVSDRFQLQQLINRSDNQIELLKKILSHNEHDSESLKKASDILEKMSSGIDKSIKKYENTEVYNKALLELQSKNDFEKTYGELQELKKQQLSTPESKKAFDDTVQFQKNSVKANQADLEQQADIEKVLQTAEQGFIPKLQAQSELGNWKTNTRLSSQMTELLADIHAIREEMRLQHQKESKSDLLNLLLTGSNIQNQKLLKEAKHE